MALEVKTKIKGLEDGKDFPKLMKSKNDDTILLFRTNDCATIISSSDKDEIGLFIRNIRQENFTDYNEEITLKNK